MDPLIRSSRYVNKTVTKNRASSLNSIDPSKTMLENNALNQDSKQKKPQPKRSELPAALSKANEKLNPQGITVMVEPRRWRKPAYIVFKTTDDVVIKRISITEFLQSAQEQNGDTGLIIDSVC